MYARNTLSAVDCEKLIKEVRKRPHIWNFGLKNRYRYAQSWNEVARLLDTDVVKCRMKWRNLRDTFKREARRCRSLQEYRGTWLFFKDMLFISTATPRVKHTQTDSSNDTRDENKIGDISDRTDNSSDYCIESGADQMDPVGTDQHDPVGSEASHENFQSVDLAVDFIKTEPYQETKLDQENESAGEGARVVRSDQEDYDLLFLRSLVPFFRELNPLSKLRVRRKVEELLMVELMEQGK